LQAEAKAIGRRAIASLGAYAPLLRLDRDSAAKALKFSGLGGRGGGRRAVAGWDDDPVTLGVEAACQAHGRPDTVVFAFTSAPFYERLQAALVVDALALPAETRARDVSGSRRCAVSALLDALLSPGSTLVAAGERRPGRAGSPLHLSQGDGGAAALVADEGAACLLGWASLSHDLIDIYASREHPEPYAYEERFVRETAVAEVFAPTIGKALARAGLASSDVQQAAVHEPLAGLWRDIGRATGISAPNHASNVAAALGDLGAASSRLRLRPRGRNRENVSCWPDSEAAATRWCWK
jgi:hydroxymethylglutaryl-CoA synthase